jgi:hypothetical protein
MRTSAASGVSNHGRRVLIVRRRVEPRHCNTTGQIEQRTLATLITDDVSARHAGTGRRRGADLRRNHATIQTSVSTNTGTTANATNRRHRNNTEIRSTSSIHRTARNVAKAHSPTHRPTQCAAAPNTPRTQPHTNACSKPVTYSRPAIAAWKGYFVSDIVVRANCRPQQLDDLRTRESSRLATTSMSRAHRMPRLATSSNATAEIHARARSRSKTTSLTVPSKFKVKNYSAKLVHARIEQIE